LFLNKAINEIDKIEMCPICLDDIKNISITTCGHKFCWDCFEHYSKVTQRVKCPSCNTLLNKNDVYLLHENVELQNDLDKLIYEIKSTKIGNIIHLVKEKLLNKNNKIIVFSQWEEILNKVGNYFERYKINILYCKGTVYQKNKSIKLFQENDNYNIILLCSRNAASGINLTKANHIIFIEPVYGTNEYRQNIENQAIGRCVRIGNNQSINVIRFIIKDTIESDIYYNNADESQLQIF
jgi:SNF2 family DNA or RNA helicase